MIKKKGQTIRLDTPNTTMLLRTDTAEYLYYGNKLVSNGDLGAVPGSGRRFLSTFGSNDYSEYSVLLKGEGGGFATDFVFSKARVFTSKPELPGLPSSYGEGKTVELKYTDSVARVALYLYFTAYEDSDVIAVSARVVNASRKEIRIRRIMSLQFDFAETGLKVVTYAWASSNGCRRCVRQEESGVFVNDSKSGSAHTVSPFVTVQGETGVVGADLVYSGNHKEVFDVSRGCSRLLVGMNDFALSYALQPGESFVAPEAVVCFAPDEEALERRMQAFVNEHICSGKWRKKERPVAVEAAGSGDVLELAEAAKEVGAELFVLDVGGEGQKFSAAGQSVSGEGSARQSVRAVDWEQLASLSEELREGGMALGIRIEPETVAEDSELCCVRPQYLMKIPGRRPFSIRGRLMLNLADEKVQNYVVRVACEAIEKSGAAYVRWDCCRAMTDCFGKGVFPGEYFHRYMLGYYRVVAKVVRRFPFVLFEGCAADGGRLDLGNLYYFSQHRFGGRADTVGRSALIRAPFAYPQSVVGAAVPVVSDGVEEGDFYAACGGVLGYVCSGAPNGETRAKIAEQIAFYKQNRKLLQFGEREWLNGEGVRGVITVSKDKSSAVAVIEYTESESSGAVPRICFKGLLPSAVYEVSVYGEDVPLLSLGGDLLMGMPVAMQGPFGAVGGKGALSRRMLIFRKKRSL